MHPIDWSWGKGVDCGPVFAPPPPTSMPTPYFPPAISAQQPATTLTPATVATAGRKRSRDETLTAEDLYDSSDMSRGSTSPPKTRPSGQRQDSLPDFGSAMALQRASQNGTWAEEVSERLRSSSLTEHGRAPRPLLEARKSARLGRDAPGIDNARATWHAQHMAKNSLDTPAAPELAGRIALDEPEHDAASIALGVGWALIPCSDAMQAAIRGWTAFLEQRYPLTSVKFEWQKRSEPRAYLVAAVTRATRTPGYFLFQEDLQCGKLVAKSWERALDNLRAVPMVFDGDVELVATDPAVIAAEQQERERLQARAHAQAQAQTGVGAMETDSTMAEPYIMQGMQGHIHQGHAFTSTDFRARVAGCASWLPASSSAGVVAQAAAQTEAGGMELD